MQDSLREGDFDAVFVEGGVEFPEVGGFDAVGAADAVFGNPDQQHEIQAVVAKAGHPHFRFFAVHVG